jgi:hypothetical protein
VSDEPLNNGPDGLQRLLDWASLVKGVDPDFKVATASVYPIPPGPPDRGWVDLVGYVDEWEIAPDEDDDRLADPYLHPIFTLYPLTDPQIWYIIESS